MARGNTWTNSDGLVVGFGTNKPEFAGNVTNNSGAGVKVAMTKFDWTNLNDAAAINVPVPAGSRVLDVRVVVKDAFTSTGTNTFEVGDGSDADGFITTTAATNAAALLAAGAVVLPDGVYSYDDTADGDATAAELKVYAAADTIDLVSAQVDWTAGTASLQVTYI